PGIAALCEALRGPTRDCRAKAPTFGRGETMSTDEGTKSGRFSEWDAGKVFGMNRVILNYQANSWRSLRESNSSFQIENIAASTLHQRVSQSRGAKSAQEQSRGYEAARKHNGRAGSLPCVKENAAAWLAVGVNRSGLWTGALVAHMRDSVEGSRIAGPPFCCGHGDAKSPASTR